MEGIAIKEWKAGRNLGREMRLGIAFEELREKPNDWDEDRRIMRNERESRLGEINKNLPTITGEEEDEEKESAISEKGDSNLEDQELVQEQHGETNVQRGGTERRFRGPRY